MTEDKIFKELAKLPALLRERVPTNAFHMKYLFSQNLEFTQDVDASCTRLAENHACGTTACVWGWSKVFAKMGLLEFDPVVNLSQPSIEFITSFAWAQHRTDYTLEAACARIEYVVEHGRAPDDWEAQVY